MNRRSGWLAGLVLYSQAVAGVVAQEGEADMSKIWMESTLAGAWYDADASRLKHELNGYLKKAKVEARPGLFAVVMPHAGYAYSGLCAAYGAKALAGQSNLNRVVVLGFAHRVQLPNRISVPAHETHYRSPLGETPLDTAALAELLENPLFADVPSTRRGENSVEMELPLLQAALEGREWKLVPVTLGQLDEGTRVRAAEALTPLMDGHTALVVSSDFTHYGPNFGYVPFCTNIEANLRLLDAGAIGKILAGDAEEFSAYCDQTGATICGQDTLGVMLRMLPAHFSARELAYDTSGSSTGDFENSVSYASLAFYREGTAMKKPKQKTETPQLSEEDKKVLLALARKAIAQALKGKALSDPGDFGVEPTPAMNQVMGGFVTLTLDGDLRGCIGEIFPRRPLVQVVLDHALDAAFEDPRFSPLTAKEFQRVRIEISALTKPVPVASYKDIEIGRHGMVLEVGSRSAVFLPQVATEQGWDLPTTLSYLAQKAGLPPDAWMEPRAKFTVFEAIVFHEPDGK